ncbi:hypothetical protein CAPTEDRAFT_178707 [Capitella teleta]|uniref:Zinc finger protein ZPR1 n=1 Tax=Capitella teleta TaxID=283909 RepID=R7UUQ2_CAPTE|nr:hypothetical protein CAPTEDRAFT_178707 [Capitella teleta]|eukprot:ELU09893.1 hypothetical protein CAPTEDRAFT_178707 [Capitella teleta]
MTSEQKTDPVFQDINADETVTEIESLCMRCYKQGVTRLLLTKIPFFREVVLSSFCCEHCHHVDSGIQSASQHQERGVKYVLQVRNSKDMNRQVVKSEVATFEIPLLEFQQPPSRKGEVINLEGMMQNVVRDLEMFQEERRKQDATTAEKLDEFLVKFKRLISLEEAPFEIILNDPSGNSFIENPDAPKPDPNLQVTRYVRSKEQNQSLGYMADDDSIEPEDEAEVEKDEDEEVNFKNEVLTFPTNCPNCSVPCETNMKLIDIPYFKETVIMATTCEACGFRDNEVKGGTGFGDNGKKIKLRLTDPSDLSRDVLKSDTCDLNIPELELEVLSGSSGGRFTTLEGLFTQIIELFEKKMPFLTGDSANQDTKTKMKVLIDKLKKASKGELMNIHVILDDPTGNSYLQNYYAPDDDPEMEVTEYERSEEQNDHLGINDMNTENYQST